MASKEDYIVLIIIIVAIYSIMTLLQKKLQVFLTDQSELLRWGLNLPLNDNQQKFLMELWISFKRKIPPDKSLYAIVSEKDLEEIKNYCSIEKLPEKLQKYSRKREQTIKQIEQLGFNSEQAFIISGLVYNKVGGIHAIKVTRSHRPY